MGSDISILMIDDNPADGDIVRRYLNDEEFPFQPEFELASSCSEAEEKLQSGDFDLILLDYRFPFGTGFDLLDRLRGSGVDLPVVMLTGQGSEQVAGKAVKESINDYLPKSELSPGRLKKTVEEIMSSPRDSRLVESSGRISKTSPSPGGGFQKLFSFLSRADGDFLFIFPIVNSSLDREVSGEFERILERDLEGTARFFFPLQIGDYFSICYLVSDIQTSFWRADTTARLEKVFDSLKYGAGKKLEPVGLQLVGVEEELNIFDPAYLLNRILDTIPENNITDHPYLQYLQLEKRGIQRIG